MPALRPAILGRMPAGARVAGELSGLLEHTLHAHKAAAGVADARGDIGSLGSSALPDALADLVVGEARVKARGREHERRGGGHAVTEVHAGPLDLLDLAVGHIPADDALPVARRGDQAGLWGLARV